MAGSHIRIVAAVVKQNDLYLITQRRPEAVLGGLWEFPGGKVEDGESDELALRRELDERLGATAHIGDKLAERHSHYPDYEVTLALYAVQLDPTVPLEKRRVADFRWIRSDEFERFPFPAADEKSMDALLGIVRR